MKNLGRKIRMIRKAAHLTQTEFAEELKATQAQVTSYELGYSQPPLRFVQALSQRYRISADWLLNVDPIPERRGSELYQQFDELIAEEIELQKKKQRRRTRT